MTAPLLNRLLAASLIWVVASFLIHELCSLDVWWHLAIGEDILRHLRVPETNLYSAGALNKPYHDSHWLFQAALALSHRLAGLNGPVPFMIVVWGLTLFILYRELRSFIGVAGATLIAFLAMGASAERFLPRPEIITFLMMMLFYSRLRQGKYETPAQILLLVALQIIWVNSHGLFVIGPFMVGCYWLVHAVRFARGRENRLQRLSLLLALVSAAMLASPYGAGALEYSLLLFREVGREAPAYMKAVNELSPTFGEAAMGAPAFWFFAALLGLTAFSLALNPRRIPMERLLIVAALCLAAFTGRRNMVLFALVAAPFIAENLSLYAGRIRIPAAGRAGLKSLLVAGMLLWSAYPLSGRYYVDMEIPARARLGVTPDFFPHGLPAFIRRHGIRGQVYNTNRLGGFYLYHFYPGRIPFMDGRWEIYGERFFRDRSRARRDYGFWKRWSAGFGVKTALLHHTSEESKTLVPALYRDPDWSLVYYDFAAAFFVKNEARGSARPIVFSADTPILEGDVRPDARLMLSVFYRNLGLRPQLLANLERTLPFGYHRREILLELAKTNLALNRYAEAEKRYRQLLEIDSGQIDALSDLSFIHYQKGDYQQALAYSERAVRAAPDNPDIRFNHALVLMALGRRPEVVGLLNDILRTRPDYWKARRLLEDIAK